MAKLLSNATAEWLQRQMAGNGDLRSRPTPFFTQEERDFMPFDVAQIGGNLCVRINGFSAGGSANVRYGYLYTGSGRRVPVDAAKCPNLATAVFGVATWYDTGVAATSGATAYLYIRDTADYTDPDTAATGTNLVWGIVGSFSGFTGSELRYVVPLATIDSAGAVAQTFHGNVSIFAPPDTLRIFEEDSGGTYQPAGPLTIQIVSDMRDTGSGVEKKTRDIEITEDGRILVSAESAWN